MAMLDVKDINGNVTLHPTVAPQRYNKSKSFTAFKRKKNFRR